MVEHGQAESSILLVDLEGHAGDEDASVAKEKANHDPCVSQDVEMRQDHEDGEEAAQTISGSYILIVQSCYWR